MATAYDAVIDNSKTTVPNLPITGAAGRVLMIVAGVALILVAVGAYMVRARHLSARR